MSRGVNINTTAPFDTLKETGKKKKLINGISKLSFRQLRAYELAAVFNDIYLIFLISF